MTDRIAVLNEALAGRYTIEREIGSGGMATVYLAEDVKHGRKVAIKVLRDDISASVGAARFDREIQIAAQLQHPSILPLLDSGDAGGMLYFVMPFVQGQSLRQRILRDGEISEGDAIRILIDIVDGLAHAHEHGILHRDIKPDNVMLSGRHALVMDFGVARAVSEATSAGQLTSIGIALGTPSYMSPEQATGDPDIDARADIYAVGILAYELLTGRPPFTGVSAQQILAAHVMEAPAPIESLRPSISPAFAHVVMKCLEKRPVDRWRDAGELLAALEQIATPSAGVASTGARPATRSRNVHGWRYIAGAVAIALIAAGIYALVRPTKITPSITLGRSVQLTTEGGLQIDPSISPDGKLVAYASGDVARTRIYVRPINGGRTIVLSNDTTAEEIEPQWSPDGSQILFHSQSGIAVAPSLGGRARVVVANTTADSVTTASWSPDGREIVYAKNDTIFVGDIGGQTHRVVSYGIADITWCRWSRRVPLIACVAGNRFARNAGAQFGNKAPSGIVVVRAAGGALMRVTSDHAMNQAPEWSPTSDRLFYVSNRDGPLDAYEVSVASDGRARGSPVRVTTGLNARALSIATDGRHVAYSVYAGHANIYSVPIPTHGTVSAADAIPITTGSQTIEAISVSSDGNWLLYDSDRDGVANIYRMPIAGGEPEALTNESFDVFAPRLSPDGRLLAYHSFRGGTRDIEVKPLDGGPVELATNTPAQESYPFWAPDSKRLVFFDQVPRGEVYVIERTSPGKWSVPRKVPFGDASGQFGAGASWSDDGQWIVMEIRRTLVASSLVTGMPHVVYAAENGEPEPESPLWGKDGRYIFFKTHDAAGHAAINEVPAGGGKPTVLVRFPDLSKPSSRKGFAMSATRFYFPIEDRESNIWLAELAR